MTTVLITRPRHDAVRLALLLEQVGYQTFIEPLLTVQPVAGAAPDGVFDAVMITSPNAAANMAAQQGDDEHLLKLPCFCVGEKSAAAARDYGFTDVCVSDGNGIDLATLIRGQLGPGKSLLHIGGIDVASAGRDRLLGWGYAVTVWAVYRAVENDALTPELCRLLNEKQIDAGLFFSPKTAAVFTHLALRGAVEACCERLSAIGLSEAVADALRPLPWRQIAVAAAPNEQEIIRCLQKFCPPAALP